MGAQLMKQHIIYVLRILLDKAKVHVMFFLCFVSEVDGTIFIEKFTLFLVFFKISQ
jgi:hypothetical protein